MASMPESSSLSRSLDEAVGVEHDGGAVREADPLVDEPGRAGAERRPEGTGQPARRRARGRQQRREVARVRVDERLVRRVVDAVDAGHDLAALEVAHGGVHELEHVGRWEVEAGVRAHRRPQLAHHRRSPHPAPHDVADHERRTAGTELDHVVPVPADLRALLACLVVGGDVQVLGLDVTCRGEAALQVLRDAVLLAGRLLRDRRRRERPLGLALLGDVLERPVEADRRAVRAEDRLAADVAPAHGAVGVHEPAVEGDLPAEATGLEGAGGALARPVRGTGRAPRRARARRARPASSRRIRSSSSEPRTSPVARSTSQLPTLARRCAWSSRSRLSCTSASSARSRPASRRARSSSSDRPDPRDELEGGEGLDEVVVGARLEALDRRLFSGAGREHHDGHVRRGRVAAQRRQQSEPVQVRHHHVRQHEVGHGRPRPLDGRGAVGRGVDGVVVGEQRGDVAAHVGVVVDDEDPRPAVGRRRAADDGVAARRVVRCRLSALARLHPSQRLLHVPGGERLGRRLVGEGQEGHLLAVEMAAAERDGDAKRAAASRDARRRGAPAEPRGQLRDEGEADAGALVGPGARLAHPVEALEQVGLVARVDADPGVGDRELHRWSPALVGTAEPHRDPAGEGELQRVGDEVGDDLGPHLPVDEDGLADGRAVEHEAEPGTRRRLVEHAGQLDGGGGEVDRLEAGGDAAGLEAREVEQGVHELQQPLGVAVDELDTRPLVGPERLVVVDEGVLRRPEQQRERRAELVAHVGEERGLGPIELGERLGAPPLGLVGAGVGDARRQLARDERDEALVARAERPVGVEAGHHEAVGAAVDGRRQRRHERCRRAGPPRRRRARRRSARGSRRRRRTCRSPPQLRASTPRRRPRRSTPAPPDRPRRHPSHTRAGRWPRRRRRGTRARRAGRTGRRRDDAPRSRRRRARCATPPARRRGRAASPCGARRSPGRCPRSRRRTSRRSGRRRR